MTEGLGFAVGKTYTFPCGCSFPIRKTFEDLSIRPLLKFNIDLAPQNCPATYALLGEGVTKGIFQLESSLGKTWTKKLKPENLEHMGALGAILRPGCLKGVDAEGVSMTQHFVRRKNHVEPITSYHPAIDAILHPTYNVLCYQEQAMFIAVAVAGFTPLEADMLRKAIGKKLPAEMARCRRMFLEGAEREGILPADKAEEVFGWIEQSQRYSFNKSHAICYGIRGYKTAYTKAHFPIAFFTAWLKHAHSKPKPFVEMRELINDAKLFNIEVRIPDFRSPKSRFHTNLKDIWFGLADIKDVGRAQVEKIRLACKESEKITKKKIGQFTWYEFLVLASSKIQANVIQACIEGGCLDWMGTQRTIMLSELHAWQSLTKLEQLWIQRRYSRFDNLVTAIRQLGQEKGQEPPKLKNVNRAIRKIKKELAVLESGGDAFSEWPGVLETTERIFDKLTNMQTAMQLELDGGGCSNKRRREIVSGTAYMLENPPTVIADTPHWLAWTEEVRLGIPITFAKIDGCDTSDVNTTCKEFYEKTRSTLHDNVFQNYYVLGVEINSVRVVKTKKGKNPGRKMAFLSVSDGTCALDDVICFPEPYKECSSLLAVGNTVIMQGTRDSKPNSHSLFVEKMWLAT